MDGNRGSDCDCLCLDGKQKKKEKKGKIKRTAVPEGTAVLVRDIREKQRFFGLES